MQYTIILQIRARKSWKIPFADKYNKSKADIVEHPLQSY